MRVLMLDLFLPNSTYTKELVCELRKYVDIDLVCTSNVTKKIDGVNMLPVFYTPGKGVVRGAGEYLHGLMKIRQLLNKNAYSIFHVQTFKNEKIEIPFYLHLMKQHPETKFVLTAHNIAPHEAPEKTKKLYQKLYDSCDMIVVHNKDCRKRLMQEYYVPYEKILLMPHGSYPIPTNCALEKNKKEKVSFLQFGCIRKYKGLDVLLQAIALLPYAVKQQCSFKIAGERLRLDDTDYEAQARQLGIDWMVDFDFRHIPNGDLPDLFQNTDFCLYPYHEISGSGALLMSFSYGIPVIASDLEPFKEETDHGAAGILFQSENPKSLSKAICSAVKMNQGKYHRMSQNARKETEKHSWKYSAKLLKNGYRELCREDVLKNYEFYRKEREKRHSK